MNRNVEAARTDESRAVMALFDQWLELPPDRRRAWLEGIRADVDAARMQQLLALIQAGNEADADRFLTGSALADALKTLAVPDENSVLPAGSLRIGPWTVEKSLGVGGMGRVWLARRDDGLYQGYVAIKMLREAAADDFARERFAREGQILARLDHPHIGRLLDAGIQSNGERYLVLEYVRGERIDAFCDGRRLDVRARIRLFLGVCEAVAHAHANLVVHRDIKPANILVMADGQAKLLDFGVAKLIDAQPGAGADSPLTRVAGAGMTLDYAAPEQIEGGTITTATDVYSLGMVLYRLLSGGRPYGSESSSLAALARDIVDTEARPLSASLADHSTPAMVQERAKARSSSPQRLQRLLRGDLDNILAKSLRKRAVERYGSVRALADDLECYLVGKPISARPDSFTYQLDKFVRRHWMGVGAGAALLVSLIGGVVGVVWQGRIAVEQEREARRQTDIARQQATLAERESVKAMTAADRAAVQEARATAEALRAVAEEGKAKEQQASAQRYRAEAQTEARRAKEQEASARSQAEVAKAESAKAAAVKDFMIDIFRANLPISGDVEKAQQLTARDLLEAGSRRIGVKFAAQPEVRSELLDIVGELFYRLGDQDKAKQLTLDRIALLDTMPGNQTTDKLESVQNLSYLAWAGGDTLSLRKATALTAAYKGNDDVFAQAINRMNAARADLYGDPAAALAAASSAVATWRESDHISLNTGANWSALEVVARAQGMLGRHDLALAAAEDAGRAIARTARAGHFSRVEVAGLIGELQRDAERLHLSERSLRAALANANRALGRTHPGTLVIQAQLGALLHAGTQRAEGMALLTEAARLSALATNRNLIEQSRMELELGRAYFDEGRFAEAQTAIADVIARVRGNPDLRLLHATGLLTQSRLHAVRGDGEKAIAAAQEARSIFSAALGDQSPSVAAAMLVLAQAEVAADRVGDARGSADAAHLSAGATGLRFNRHKTLNDLLQAEMQLIWGERMAARAHLESLVERIASDDEADYLGDLLARATLGAGRAAFVTGEFARARVLLERAVARYSRLGPADSPWLADARVALADCLISINERHAAAGLLAQADAAFGKHLPLGRQFLYPLEKVRQRL